MSEEQNLQAAALGRDKDMAPVPGEGKTRGRRRRKVSYLTINKIEYVDYKDIAILRRFVNDRGKMIPSRQTGNTAKQQRMIARAIRRARELALLPFVVTDFVHDRRDFTGRGGRPDRGPREPRQPEEAPAAVEAAAPQAVAEPAPEVAPAPVEAPAEAPAEAPVESAEAAPAEA